MHHLRREEEVIPLQRLAGRGSITTMQLNPQTDNFAYIVLVDYRLHTPEKPFCYDESCSCHEDELLVAEVSLHVQDGLLTPDEATEFVKGKGI